MYEFFIMVWAWIKSFWETRNEMDDSSFDQKDDIDQKTPRKRKARRKKRDHYGTMYYMGDLLDCLDDYFNALHQLKKHDKDAFALYKRIGGLTFSTEGLWLQMYEASSSWTYNPYRPSFGMVHFVTSDHKNKDKMNMIMGYYQKQKPAPFVQRAIGECDIYKVSMFFGRRDDKVKDLLEYYISVDKDASMMLLKENKPVWHKLPNGERIPQRQWHNPPSLQAMCWEYKKEHKGEDISPAEMARNVFCLITNTVENASMGLEVRAKKKGLTAAFSIDMLRTPYFFKDRVKTVNHNGRTKRIFHITRTHERVLPSGKTKIIPTHFRGLSEFQWMGYDVKITLAGYHHINFREFGVESIDMEAPEMEDVKGGTLTQKDVAKRFAIHLQGKPLSADDDKEIELIFPERRSFKNEQPQTSI